MCLLLLAARLDASQTVGLTLSTLETHVNHTMRIELLLHRSSNLAPAGLQWVFRLPPGVKIMGIEAGAAVREAGKSLVCNGAKCLVYGMNRTTISNGPIAVLTVTVERGFASAKSSARYEAHGRARMTREEIQIGDPVAVSLQGKSIPVVSDNGIASPSKTH